MSWTMLRIMRRWPTVDDLHQKRCCACVNCNNICCISITKKKLCKRDDDIFSVAVAGHFWRIRIRHVLHIFAYTVGLFCANNFI